MRASFLPKCAAFCALSALATATTTSLNVNPKALSPNLRIPVNPSGFTGPATGSNLGEVFEFETPGSMILNDPSIDGNGNIFLSLSFGYVYGINGQNGAQMWSYHSNDGSALGQAIVSTYGTVVVPTTKGAICLSATTGTLLWSFTDGLTMLLPSSIILTDPTDVSNAVFIAGRGSGATGSLYSYNGNTGAQNWMQPTNGATAAMDIGNGQVSVMVVLNRPAARSSSCTSY